MLSHAAPFDHTIPTLLSVRLLSVTEACTLLGIKRTQFYKIVGEERLSVVKLGRRTLVRTDELQRFIDSLAKGTAGRLRSEAAETAR